MNGDSEIWALALRHPYEAVGIWLAYMWVLVTCTILTPRQS